MVHGAVRSLFQLLGALIVVLLIALTLLAWRLSAGPIALDFLTPYIEEALTSAESGFAVRLDGTVLTMAPSGRMIEVRALGVRSMVGEQSIAAVPEMAVSLNMRALLSGILAPNSVVLYRPRLTLVRDETGRVVLGVGEGHSPSVAKEGGSADPVVRLLLDALTGDLSPSQPGRYLQRFAVIDASIAVDDLRSHAHWTIPDADLNVQRMTDGLSLTLHLGTELAGEPGSLDVKGAYRLSSGLLDTDVRIDGLRPAQLSRLDPELSVLSALDVPLSGSGHVTVGTDGRVHGGRIDLRAGAGVLDLPAPVSLHRPVDGLILRGTVAEGLSSVRIEEFTADFGGPRLSLAGSVEDLGRSPKIQMDASLKDVPFDKLSELWPAVVAPNPREWVLKNLSQGVAHEAKASLVAHSSSASFDDLVVDHLAGELIGDGVTVDYLHPMPVVRNAAAVATFDASAFNIAIKGGEVYGLRVADGKIVLSGLNQPDQFADIDLTVGGPAADALKLIDSRPLRYAQALGIEAASVGGETTTHFKMKFPLLKSLRLDDLAIKAHVALKDVSVPRVLMGQDLTHGNLDMEVDAKGLDASGPIMLGGIAGDLKWRENFSSKGMPFRSRYQLTVPRVDEPQRKVLGLDTVPFVSPYLSGPVGATVVATLWAGGRGEIEVQADLSATAMRLPGLGWRKQERTSGKAEVSVRLEKGKLSSVPHFAVTAGDLKAVGSVDFNADGSARRVDLSRLAYGGRTDAQMGVTFLPSGELDVVLKGESFDAGPIISPDEDEREYEKARSQGGAKVKDMTPMTISAQVRTLWLAQENGRLNDAVASLHRQKGDWQKVSVKGKVDGGKPFALAVQPGSPNRRLLHVQSDDAGEVLRAFGAYDYMIGGGLKLDAWIDDSQESQPIAGTISISDYAIVNAPALARLLTVAALTGVLDILQGQGVSFTHLHVPFVLTDGVLQVKEARAYGPALGITAKGDIDLDRERIALEGTVVPAYALNSVLGKIPVLGWLVTGGETGSGLLAFNYSMRGPSQDPDVVVNPLSVLTPGFLRNLFNIFDGEGDGGNRSPSGTGNGETGSSQGGVPQGLQGLPGAQ